MIIPSALLVRLRSARRPLVLTGAGISAESGIPTFRDALTGLWARFRPEDLATPEAFEADPKLVWDWYVWRRSLLATVTPNAGHHALVALQKRWPQLLVVTQNVDGLHQTAGSQNVLELHGNLNQTICHRTGRPVSAQWLTEHPDSPPVSPHHPDGLCRPAVVWFGEALPQTPLRKAREAAHTCDIFLSIGTSSTVEPAASLAVLAQRNGAFVVEINPAQTPLTPLVDVALHGAAGEILPRLITSLENVEIQ